MKIIRKIKYERMVCPVCSSFQSVDIDSEDVAYCKYCMNVIMCEAKENE